MSTVLKNPNPKTFAFELPCRILSKLQNVVIKREEAKNSLLATDLFDNFADAIEIFIRRGTGKDYVNIEKSSGIWTDREMQFALYIAKTFLENGETPLNEEALKKVAATAFVPATLSEEIVAGTFQERILPALEGDGGYMEIVRVIDNDDNTVDVEAYSAGACTSCGSKSTTVLYAEKELSEMFKMMAEDTGGKVFKSLLMVAAPQAPKPA